MNKMPKSLRAMSQALPATAKIHKAEDGGFWVESPQLTGCFASGDTVGETLHNLKFAIFDYFDVPKKYQKASYLEIQMKEIPEPTSINRPESVRFIPTQELAMA